MRSLIPHHRDKDEPAPALLKHPGLYAYRRDFLLKYVTLAATPLEETEKLEQLRALEHGYKIRIIQTASISGQKEPRNCGRFAHVSRRI